MRLLAFKREARFGLWDRLVNPDLVGVQVLTICFTYPSTTTATSAHIPSIRVLGPWTLVSVMVESKTNLLSIC